MNLYIFLLLLVNANCFWKKAYRTIHQKASVSINMHNWYVIGEIKDFQVNKPKKVFVKNTPITIWRNIYDDFSGIYDVCPHRGASLSKGRICSSTNSVVCPYHTFKFNPYGRLIQTPGQTYLRKSQHYNVKTDVAHYKVIKKGQWVYLYNHPLYDVVNTDAIEPWIEPEHHDDSYCCVYLNKKFKMDARTVTENSLDILHISEVHSFGNKKRPLPYDEKIEHIDDGHYKIIYNYETGEDSIPKVLYNNNKLVIENEYILPHYTVARVIFGPFVNTIVTSALPIDNENTHLFVRAYRNNLNVPVFNAMFDMMTRYLMDKTLKEDKNVIESIYREYRDGNFITKYDELTRKYREDYQCFTEQFEEMTKCK